MHPLNRLSFLMVGMTSVTASDVASATTKLNAVYGTPEDYTRAIQRLRAVLSAEAVSIERDVLDTHGRAIGSTTLSPPTVVTYPTSTEDVVNIVNISRKYRMPITPYSGATAMEGHFVASEAGGICVDMSRMDKILKIHEADGDLVCQAGAKWVVINETLAQKGIPLFFPLDPGLGATIGGMIGTGCSGTNSVKYGTAKGEWFLNATIVLPSGEVMKTRRRSRKCSSGFDSLKLFIGAEGTLGIVTEATIRLAPLLPTRVAVVQFPSVEYATRASTETLNYGVNLQCVEFLDKLSMKGLNAYNRDKRQWPEKDTLFVKIQGFSQVFIEESARILKTVAEKHGGTGWEFAASEKEAEDLWYSRKMAMMAGYAMGGLGCKAIATDVCVPVSRLPELVCASRRDFDASGLLAPIIGHVGDGNLHAMLIYHNDEEHKIAVELGDKMVQHALDLDGTCTGEHGIGVGKKRYLVEELGGSTVEFMKHVKQSIDPLNLFNPGKLYPN